MDVFVGDEWAENHNELARQSTPSGTVTDTLWTAFGPLVNFTIPSLDAAVDLTPADIVPVGFDVPSL